MDSLIWYKVVNIQISFFFNVIFVPIFSMTNIEWMFGGSTSCLRAEWWDRWFYWRLVQPVKIWCKIFFLLLFRAPKALMGSVWSPHGSFLCLTSLTCSVDVEVSGFVSNVAHRFESCSFDGDLGGVAQRFVHIHFKWTFRNLLASKQYRHLRNRKNYYFENFIYTC